MTRWILNIVLRMHHANLVVPGVPWERRDCFAQLGHGAGSPLFGPWCKVHILMGRLGEGVGPYTSRNSLCSPHGPDSSYGQGDKPPSLRAAPCVPAPLTLLLLIYTFLASVFPEGPRSSLDGGVYPCLGKMSGISHISPWGTV